MFNTTTSTSTYSTRKRKVEKFASELTDTYSAKKKKSSKAKKKDVQSHPLSEHSKLFQKFVADSSDRHDSNDTAKSGLKELPIDNQKPQNVNYGEFLEFFSVLPKPHIILLPLSAKYRALTGLTPQFFCSRIFCTPTSLKNKKKIQDVNPKFVIFYDLDIAFFRQLEIYRNERPGLALRCYWLVYKDSIEEQIYLSALERENEAFKFLIQQKKVCHTHKKKLTFFSFDFRNFRFMIGFGFD